MIAYLAIVLLGQVGLGIDRSLPAPTPKPVVVSCSAAADPSIESATDEKAENSPTGVDTYIIHVSILNRGSKAQSTKTKQVVSVYSNEERIQQMTVPPLEAGEAFAFTMRFKRSSDAGVDSTTLLFRLGGLTYAPNSVEDCNQKNNSFRLTF
jgi:hypothetical protein